jgi:proteasome assembly chaperone (PAC2) family protein
LEVLQGVLGIEVDLAPLDSEIEKAEKMVSRLQKVEEKRALQTEELRKEEDEKIKYIS